MFLVFLLITSKNYSVSDIVSDPHNCSRKLIFSQAHFNEKRFCVSHHTFNVKKSKNIAFYQNQLTTDLRSRIPRVILKYTLLFPNNAAFPWLQVVLLFFELSVKYWGFPLHLFKLRSKRSLFLRNFCLKNLFNDSFVQSFSLNVYLFYWFL